MYRLTVLEAESPSRTRWQSSFLPRAARESVFQASLFASSDLFRNFGIAWLVEASPDLCLYAHLAFSLCVCVCLCVQKSSFYEDTIILD